MSIQFSDEELKQCGILKKPYSSPRLTSINPLDPSNSERFSLSAHWVGLACGDFKSDVMCNIAGKKGSGKSYSSIELARLCAIRTAIKLDNDESKWKDYFDIERNVAIMDSDKLIEILTSQEAHQVIVSDDSGVIQGARQFRSADNQALNSVFVVNRTLNNIYLSSAPESKHVDRQARDLPEHQLDFERNEAAMSQGYAICKYFQKVTDPKTSESYYHYNFWRDAKVVRVVIPKPPKYMCDEYDKLRDEGRRRIQQVLKEIKEKRDEKMLPKKSAAEVRQEKLQERLNLANDTYSRLLETASSKTDCLRRVSVETKIPFSTLKSWQVSGKIGI